MNVLEADWLLENVVWSWNTLEWPYITKVQQQQPTWACSIAIIIQK